MYTLLYDRYRGCGCVQDESHLCPSSSSKVIIIQLTSMKWFWLTPNNVPLIFSHLSAFPWFHLTAKKMQRVYKECMSYLTCWNETEMLEYDVFLRRNGKILHLPKMSGVIESNAASTNYLVGVCTLVILLFFICLFFNWIFIYCNFTLREETLQHDLAWFYYFTPQNPAILKFHFYS